MHLVSLPTEGSSRASRKPKIEAQPSDLAPSYFARVLAKLSRETTSGRFIPQMDGLRFIAIAMVILFHLNAYLMAKARLYEHGARDWLCQTALVGSHGVELFFVISGFILALPFAAHRLGDGPPVGLRKYYLRRLTRLEPPYIATLLLLAGLMYWVRPANAPLGSHVAASLFYLHNLIYGAPSTAMGVAWSLEIEVQFYLLVPLLTLLFLIRSVALRRTLIVTGAVIAVIVQTEFSGANSRFELSILGYLQFFLIGFLLADIFLIDWNVPPRWPMLWDAVSFIGWPALFLSLQSARLTHWLFPLIVLLLYCAAFRGRWTNRLLSLPWLTAIGGMCYSIYLIHYEVISAVGRFSKVIGEGLPNSVFLMIQFAIVGTAIVVICGTYFLILEKPCMKRDWPSHLWKRIRAALPRKSEEAESSFAD